MYLILSKESLVSSQPFKVGLVDQVVVCGLITEEQTVLVLRLQRLLNGYSICRV